MRVGLGVAAVALVMLAACGGSDGPGEVAPKASATTNGVNSMKKACAVVNDIWVSNVGETVTEEVAAYSKAEERLAAAVDGLSTSEARGIIAWQVAIGNLVETKSSGSSTPAEGANAYADYLAGFKGASDDCTAAGFPPS
jgi:hypothetical protein